MRMGFLVSLLIIGVTLGGCLGAEDTPGLAETSDGVSPSSSDAANDTAAPAPGETPPIALNVSIREAPAKVKAGESLRIVWAVAVDQPNATRENITSSLRWGATNVGEGDLREDSYPNEAGRVEDAAAPADFEAAFAVATAGTIYARAVAADNGTLYWSEEITIVVEPAVKPTIHTVNIYAAGPVGTFLGTSNSMSITIKVGDGVKWHNNDNVAPHSAEADAGAPAAFNSGSAGGGQDTGIVYFDKPGTYAYHCGVHPSTMTGPAGGRIVVQ